MPRTTRFFLLAVAAFSVVLGARIHHSDYRSGDIVLTPFRPERHPSQRDLLTPENRARCPEGPVYSGVHPPRKISDVAPVYPEAAREMSVSGVVILQVLIDKGGEIAAAKVVRSVPALDAAAINAVKQWKFEPTRVNGAPVCVGMTVTVDVRP